MGPIRRFFDWYALRFAAYSFALARRNEFEAYALSIRLTSRDDAGAALVNVHVTAPWVDGECWRTRFRNSDETPDPPHLPWTGLNRFLAASNRAHDDVEASPAKALEQATGYENTHPSLRDRLAALGAAGAVPTPTKQSAAHCWLGERFVTVIADFDREWLDANRENWRARHEHMLEGRGRLEALEQHDRASLGDEEPRQYGLLLQEFRSDAAARPVLELCHERNPKDPELAMILGRMLHEQDDLACIEHFKLAVESPEFALEACHRAWRLLGSKQLPDDAETWRVTAQRLGGEQEAARAERARLAPVDALEPAEMPPALREQLKTQLERSTYVRRAWLVRKRVRHYPELPVCAVAFAVKGLHFSDDSVIRMLAASIDFEHELFLVPKTGDYKKLAGRTIKSGERIV